jgi:hypothetical protein
MSIRNHISLVRKITFTEVIESDGTRRIEDISEAFLNPRYGPIETAKAVSIAQTAMGINREKEKLPQADGLGRYPPPADIACIFQDWPPHENQNAQEFATSDSPGRNRSEFL